MKRRLLATLLLLAMAFSLIPAVSAENTAEHHLPGSNIALAASAVDSQNIIIDNSDSESVSVIGNYTTGSSRSGKYGENYYVLQKGASIVWTPKLTQAGDYRVYYMQPDGTTDAQSIATAATFTIHHYFGKEDINVNQINIGGE